MSGLHVYHNLSGYFTLSCRNDGRLREIRPWTENSRYQFLSSISRLSISFQSIGLNKRSLRVALLWYSYKCGRCGRAPSRSAGCQRSSSTTQPHVNQSSIIIYTCVTQHSASVGVSVRMKMLIMQPPCRHFERLFVGAFISRLLQPFHSGLLDGHNANFCSSYALHSTSGLLHFLDCGFCHSGNYIAGLEERGYDT